MTHEAWEPAAIVTVTKWGLLWDEELGKVDTPEDAGMTEPMDFPFTFGEVWKAEPDAEFDETEDDNAAILRMLVYSIEKETGCEPKDAEFRWLPEHGEVER